MTHLSKIALPSVRNCKLKTIVIRKFTDAAAAVQMWQWRSPPKFLGAPNIVT